MDIQSVKIELAKLILSLENPVLIKKLHDFVHNHSEDFADTLTPNEKEEIELASRLMNEGNKTPFNEFLRNVS